MHTKTYISSFDKKLSQRIEDLHMFNDKEITLQTSPTSWSLGLLYDHILRVARTYQIPNFKKSLTHEADRRGGQNIFGFILFDIGFLPRINIQMESFPPVLAEKFTPELKSKQELLEDYKRFGEEVHALLPALEKSTADTKTYHPMFGTIPAYKWFDLMRIHMHHHEKQKRRIIRYIEKHRS